MLALERVFEHQIYIHYNAPIDVKKRWVFYIQSRTSV